jgi:hypothetical protein
MTTPTSIAATAGHGLHRSFLPSASSLPPDRRGRLRNGARRLSGRTSLRRPHALRWQLPPARHGQRPLPPAWRSQHRSAHARGPRTLRPRPAHPRRLHRRHPGAHGGSPRLDQAHPRPHRPHAPPPHRWAWSASASFQRTEDRCRNAVTARRDHTGAAASLRPTLSSVFCRPSSVRWAWGPSAGFALPAEPARRPSPLRRRPARAVLRWAWGASVIFRTGPVSGGPWGQRGGRFVGSAADGVMSRHPFR